MLIYCCASLSVAFLALPCRSGGLLAVSLAWSAACLVCFFTASEASSAFFGNSSLTCLAVSFSLSAACCAPGLITFSAAQQQMSASACTYHVIHTLCLSTWSYGLEYPVAKRRKHKTMQSHTYTTPHIHCTLACCIDKHGNCHTCQQHQMPALTA